MQKHVFKLTALFAFVFIAVSGWFAIRSKAPQPRLPQLSDRWKPLFSSIDPSWHPQLTTVEAGATLARTDCALCHRQPEPNVLPVDSWLEVFATHIRNFSQTGILVDAEKVNFHQLGPLASGRLAMPAQAQRAIRLQRSDVLNIAFYYLIEASTGRAVTTQTHPNSAAPIAPFELSYVEAATAENSALYSLVHYDTATELFLLGNSATRSIGVRSLHGDHITELPIFGIFPLGFISRPDSLYAVIGGESFQSIAEPEEAPSGKILKYSWPLVQTRGMSKAPQALLRGLRFPIHAYFADFDGDGQDDLLVEEFGKSEGALSWYQGNAGTFEHRHIIFDGAGTLASLIKDFNGDGRPDVLALVTQAEESIYYFENLGGGRFATQRLWQEHPAFGFDAMYLADLDGDGRSELVTVNGDNDLETQPLRWYHGVRVWRISSDMRLAPVFFYPMHGAMQAVLRDFDLDGRIDILAIAFWPNFAKRPLETAVYLHNAGGFSFIPHRIAGSEQGRWAVLDAGDFDQDGDDDIVMAALYQPGSWRRWQQQLGSQPAAWAVFRNTTRENGL